MKKKIGNALALYPTPLVVVGAMVDGKPNWLLVGHVGIIGHDHVMVSLASAHYTNKGIKESKKLLHLTVFDGERERCILSGIAKWYKPEDLIGKKVGIVANLAPRPMLKGKYTSEGMIVAADTADGGCTIAFYPDDAAAGSRIH